MSNREVSGEIEIAPMKPSRADLSERIAVHDVQLANGQKSFAEFRQRLGEIDARTTPKPFGVAHLFGIISVIITVGGMIWTLSFLFADRPTREQVKEVVDQQRSGITEQGRDVKALRDDVVRQGLLIESVKAQITETSHKIDRLIDVTWAKTRGKSPAAMPTKLPKP